MASNTNSSATCGICSELYQDPRMLNCLHSFCKKCLEKRLDKGPSKSSLACPTCNESSSLSSRGIESLSKDHRKTYEAEVAEFEGLIKGEKSVSCDHCVKRQAAFFCCSCCEFLCEKCADHHRSWRKTQNHELVSTKEGGKENIFKSVAHKPLTCSVHSKESLDYYCNTCNDLLCIRCVVGKHKEHAYEEMDSVREKEKSELISYLGKTEAAKDKLKNSISRVEKVMQGVQANHKEVDQKINDIFNHLQRKLKARKDALLAKSADVALGKETALTLQSEELKKMEDSFSEICSKLESVTQEYTAVEMLSAKQPITIRAQQLLGKFDKICSLDPCKLDIMPVSLLSTQLENEIDTFGAVCGGCIPGQSTIDLVKPTAVVGKERKLLLTARDDNGKPYTRGREPVKVSLALMGSNEAGISGVVVDKKDGTYGISFTPNAAGEHKLSITISNEQIEESPFALYVRQPRNYTSLYACSRTFSVSHYPGGVAVDDDNNVYIAVNGHHCISVFDQNGSNIRTIGRFGSADGQFSGPFGIALKGDIIYVADTSNDRIQKLTLDGKFISKFGSSGSGNGQLSTPRGITIDKNGRVFVSEFSNRRVSVFQSDGEFSHHIQGNYAADDSALCNPWGLAFDDDGNLHVVNYGSNLIKMFTPEGNFVSQYSGVIQHPSAIAIDDEGFTFIGQYYNRNTKYNHSQLIILNAQHQQVHIIQKFKYVPGLCIDKDGNVFVCDYNNRRVMKY
ncbi:E3 ubiquitin-protein ligase TRIM71-like [Halichondria panicea]|uniref:E3 ubiquitin-protein ligase TRIM71-like n=1 Tax=Halichondria panicea TaxID=6063 RepID=UPI00312B87D0